jgi:cytochrome bd-type quinol oxidase subunit 2
MPTGPPPAWATLVFVLPALVGLAVGLLCRSAGELRDRLRAVAVAAVLAAAGVGVFAALSGGRLAGGPFDPVDVPVWAAAAATLGWIALPAALTCLGELAGRAKRPADRAARRTRDRSQ